MIRRLFLDTNVMRDILCERKPHYDAAKLMVLKQEGLIQIIVASLSFVTCHYVMSKTIGKISASEMLQKFRILSEVAEFDGINILNSILNSIDKVYFQNSLTLKMPFTIFQH
jgi:predicted nucleic acid-binding protein